jgi:hypothetical protein
MKKKAARKAAKKARKLDAELQLRHHAQQYFTQLAADMQGAQCYYCYFRQQAYTQLCSVLPTVLYGSSVSRGATTSSGSH